MVERTNGRCGKMAQKASVPQGAHSKSYLIQLFYRELPELSIDGSEPIKRTEDPQFLKTGLPDRNRHFSSEDKHLLVSASLLDGKPGWLLLKCCRVRVLIKN